MAEAPQTGGKGFLNQEVAGLPNWAWIAVIAAGIGAVYIVPKFFGNKASSSTSSSGTSGLGLAIDPTTGQPYAVEGLVPAGGLAGAGGGPLVVNGGLPPVPSAGPGGPPSDATFVTTTGKQSLDDLAALGKDWGAGTIRTIGEFNYAALYNHPLNTPLPAGEVIQVGGQTPYYTAPSTTATTPTWPGNTTQFRMVGG